MDLAERARAFLASGGEGLLAPACAARRNGEPAQAVEVAAVLRGATADDLGVKRNLVFLQWQRGEAKGAAVLAWDQDGHVTALDVWD